MCGIVGQMGWQSSYQNKKRALLSLAHRGPDGEGEWNSPSGYAWLAHRRLSIVDLSDAGFQPMHNENSTVWMVCNGEIYNYYNLRKRLEALGHSFYSYSDSECIIHAYEQWGENCVEKLYGMFAFAIWDENENKLLLARDRVGIKPLYYSQTSTGLVFGSELRSLYSLLRKDLPINPLSVAYIFSMTYIPTPSTIRKGIYKLEMGHILTYSVHNGLCIKKYWEPPTIIDTCNKNVNQVWENLFSTVLEEHLLSDVPIGLFLSAGLDSSSIALGLSNLGYPVEAITVGFPTQPLQNEAPLATKLSQHLDINHSIIEIIDEDVNYLRKKVAQKFDEPVGGTALLTMLKICQVAAIQKGYKVVLGGDGGDEVFGGYMWYRKLPGTSLRNKLGNYKAQLRHFLNKDKRNSFFSRSPLHRHISRISSNKLLPQEIEKLLRPMGIRFGEDEWLAPFEKHYIPKLPLRRRLQRIDLMTFCTDEVLFKVDRASMAYGLEVRVPFLDHRIIEFGLSLPISIEEQSRGKMILSVYLKQNVPPEILSFPKQGFSLRSLKGFDWKNAENEINNGYWIREGLISSDWTMFAQNTIYPVYIWKLLALTDWAEEWLT